MQHHTGAGKKAFKVSVPSSQDEQRQGLRPGIFPAPRTVEPSEQMTEKAATGTRKGVGNQIGTRSFPSEKVTARPHTEHGAGPSTSPGRGTACPVCRENPSSSPTAQHKYCLLYKPPSASTHTCTHMHAHTRTPFRTLINL